MTTKSFLQVFWLICTSLGGASEESEPTADICPVGGRDQGQVWDQ